MPAAPQEVRTVGSEALDGAPADHFAWMKKPSGIAREVAIAIIKNQ
jgi:hypothetical protein